MEGRLAQYEAMEAENAALRSRVKELEAQRSQDKTQPSPVGLGRQPIKPEAAELAQGKELCRSEMAQEQEQDEDDPTKVFVYGRNGCDKTTGMHKELTKAGIPYERRDFDKDKRYLSALYNSGCSSAEAAKPPVVCRGVRAWWDEPGAKGAEGDMFAFSFSATPAMELRQTLGSGGMQHIEAPVRLDADIDTEIQERFLSMQQAFLKVDGNSDGRITKKELMAKCKEWNIPTSEAERVLTEADIDLDGSLSFDEFAKRFSSNFSSPLGGTARKGSIPKGGKKPLNSTAPLRQR